MNIAKIEGGPSYKHMIRRQNATGDDSVSCATLLNSNIHQSNVGTQLPLGLSSLRDRLLPWLGGTDLKTQDLIRMLNALKVATESYLEAPISDVEVVLPFPTTAAFLDMLRSSCSSLSLAMPLSAQPPAGILAARAYGLVGQCPAALDPSSSAPDSDPEQLLLTVDYSRAALTAMLVVEECGVFEYRRVVHDTSLGTDVIAADAESPNFLDSQTKLVRALHKLLDLPLQDGNGAGLTHVSGLALLGESADDQHLYRALKEVLGQHHSDVIARASGSGTSMADPLFAASAGVAEDCLDRLNFEDVGM